MKYILLASVLSLSQAHLWAFSTTELSQKIQQNKSIQGNFNETHYLAPNDKPVQNSGQFLLLPQQHSVIWQIQQPSERISRIKPNEIRHWDGKSWHDFSGDIRFENHLTSQLLPELLTANTNALKQQFTITLSGSHKNWHLTLKPKIKLLQHDLQSINLYGDNIVRRIEWHKKNGNRVVTQFEQIQINTPFNHFQPFLSP